MSNKKAARIRKGAGLGLAAAGLLGSAVALNGTPAAHAADAPATTTPIKHVVVIYDENISFDHYFGTYPYAANVPGDGPAFTAMPDTLKKNTITNFTSNPSLLAGIGGVVSGSAIPGANGTAGSNPNTVAPFLVDHDHQWMCSQGHAYNAEQKAMDPNASGTPLMDQFVENTSSSPTCATSAATAPDGKTEFQRTGLSMSYADGNTVTGLWNYAQNFAMSDNSWADNFGPSTVGALNVVAGQTGGAVLYNSPTYPSGKTYDPATAANGDAGLFKTSDGSLPTVTTSATGSYTGAIGGTGGNVNGFSFVNGTDDTDGTKATVTGDPTPAYDECTDANIAVGMQGQNIGDLLTAKNITWGSFLGGFSIGGDGTASGTNCNYSSVTAKDGVNADGDKYHAAASPDYVPHHNPFQYYKSTSNPAHTAPANGAEIGNAGAANHMYDLSWFDKAVNNVDGATLPSVSYVRPIKAEDGHGGNSDPLDEQAFLTRTINEIQKSSYWKDTAIVIAYDDSDGFYDQVAPTITNGASDTAVNTNLCTKAPTAGTPLGGLDDRCGPSQRLPFLVISPYSKQNYIDHAHTSQASVVNFIESNWLGGQSVDDTAVSGSFDKAAGSISGMFDFAAAPRLTPVVLASNGTVVSGGIKPPTTTTPVGGTKTPPVVNTKLKAAQAKLAKDQKALKAAKKQLKKAKGHKKAVLKKKVAKLNKSIKKDKAKVKAAA